MRINKFSQNHEGNQPIRVLQFNITYQFEMTNPDFIEMSKKLFKTGQLQPKINYCINSFPILYKLDDHIQTPFIDRKGKITIHETFLSYVWCVCYSLLVIYEEAISKPINNNFQNKTTHSIDEAKIDKALMLLNYGKSLIKKFTIWDKENLPNPEIFYNSDALFIEKTNGIFVYAMNFILCHEFAHAEKEHIAKKINGFTFSYQKIEFENEADKRSIELILKDIDVENKISAELGILIGMCSQLFFRRETTSATHPAIDNKINDFLELVNPEYDSMLWAIAILAYKLWDNQFNINFVWPQETNDYEELYYKIKFQIDEKKIYERL
jgi:hypothetical protein